MKVICLWLIVASLLAPPMAAQTSTLRGQVLDESGAVVPGAKVILAGPAKISKATTSAATDGSYSFNNLPPGLYTVQASAPNLILRQPAKILLKAGMQTLDLLLNVAAENQQVTVADSGGPTIGTDAASNASAVVLRGTDLDALSDNPDDLAADLQSLAGPAAGPNGGTVFVDGFSGGELPPKNAIREIQINQNPFSPEYDKLGFGRIEIFTKPGTDKFHGSVGYNFANDATNSRNAYAALKAPFHLNELSGTLSGPINKRASFNFNLIREWVDNGNVINGVTLEPQTLVAAPFTGTLLSSLRRTGVTPRIDYQLSTNHTLTIRYSFNRDDVQNAGVGSLNLVSRGYHNIADSQTVQLTETAVLGASVVNEARFQYYRPTILSEANSAGFALQVLGAFNGGGAPIGHTTDTQNTYEFQNYTSVIRGVHAWRFGVRLREATDFNTSPQNFGGTFTFSGGLASQLDSDNMPVLDAAGQPVLINISSIESYRRTLLFQQIGLSASEIRQLGGGASQFSISSGSPLISGRQLDLGAFVGDNWRVRRNLTLNLGLRYETQTNIHDWRDIAPRIGLAWAPGSGSGTNRSKSVIRAGFGIFYDRFSLANTLTARRYNGIVQQQYTISNPDFFPTVPSVESLSGPLPPSTIQQISSTLRAPYLTQSAMSFERQVPLNTTIAITYANSHGLHELRSADINAPLPGTYVPSIPDSGVFPFGRPGQVLLTESAGLYNQNQLILSVNCKASNDISLIGSYMYNRAMSNTDGIATFPAKPYDMAGEYGPAATDMHHRVALSGTVITKWGIHLNPLLTANTGPPFDITTGQDLYGDTLFNARPGIATDPFKPGVIETRYGLLDPNPTPGERLLPRNFGRGPGQIVLNLRVGRTFAFGSPREAGTTPHSGSGAGQSSTVLSSDRRYSLTVSVRVRNLTNHNNPGPVIGNISSPLFGLANQPAGTSTSIFSENANNRQVELQTRFTF